MPGRSRRTSPRDDILAEIARALNAQSEAVVMFHSWVAQSMGLDPTAYKTLFLLNRLGPLSAGELSRETGLAPTSVTDLIDRLVARGFVTREPHSKDRRRIVVTLVHEKVTDARAGFGVPNPSLRGLCERYAVRDLEIIADFLNRNAVRLKDDLLDELAGEREAPEPPAPRH